MFHDGDGKGQVFASATAATPLQQLQPAPCDAPLEFKTPAEHLQQCTEERWETDATRTSAVGIRQHTSAYVSVCQPGEERRETDATPGVVEKRKCKYTPLNANTLL